MITLHIWAIFSIILSIGLWRFAVPNLKSISANIGRYTLVLVFLLAFVLRIVLSSQSLGFGADIACFSAWADRMVQVGPGQFYSADFFSDYPPLYLYILGFIGLLKKLFGIATYSPVHILLLKFPAILADMGIGAIIYVSGKKHVGIQSALALASLYMFQPVIILNTCLWGQIDSVFVFPLLLMCMFFERQLLFPGFLCYGLGVLIKPQMIIFTPILLVAVWDYVFHPRFSSQHLFKTIVYGLLTLIIMILLSSPFQLLKVVLQYTDTLSSYPYASVNAYNFWAMLGLNWASQDTLFLGIPCHIWGTLSIIIAAGLSIILGMIFVRKNGCYGLMGALLITLVFTFSVRMHERYLLPVFALLLFSYPGLSGQQLLSNKPQLSFSAKIIYPALFTLLSVVQFYNVGHILYYYDPANYSSTAPILRFTGFGTVVCALLMGVTILTFFRVTNKAPEKAIKKTAPLTSPVTTKKERKDVKVKPLDIGILLGITILYSIFALRDLGDTKAPETYLELSEGTTINLQFEKNQIPTKLSYYLAPYHNREFTLQTNVASNRQEWFSCDITLTDVFTWKTIDLPITGRQLSLTAKDKDTRILEWVFLDDNNHVVTAKNTADYPELFDEASLYPDYFSFRNSMYFDEIYHARTAYEFTKGYYSYENTHPPLGKFLISLGISIFGMNPFGWRIVGTFFGILMVPLLYLFGKKLTGSTAVSTVICWIFAFDFMHFTQTRIATIDVYIVFFTICMYYCFYHFYSADFWHEKGLTYYLPLALCGLSMGLGIASKWTGIYAGAGMGILFLVKMGYHYMQYKKAKENPDAKTGSVSNQKILELFPKKATATIGFCIIFFVLLPVLIYLLSYIPFRNHAGDGLLKRMLENQKSMFSYHSSLNATHYFSSPFYEWPIIKKPIWYYSGIISTTLHEGISAFGNPLVWWTGIPAFVYMLYLVIKRRDYKALFLTVGYLAQYLPWFFVTRITFIYHYFPSVIFVVLMIGYCFNDLSNRLPKKKMLTIMAFYCAFVFLLFMMYYPVLSGQPVDTAYVFKYLKWFKDWVLIAG